MMKVKAGKSAHQNSNIISLVEPSQLWQVQPSLPPSWPSSAISHISKMPRPADSLHAAVHQSACTPTLKGADRAARDLRKNIPYAMLEFDVWESFCLAAKNGTEDGMLQSQYYMISTREGINIGKEE